MNMNYEFYTHLHHHHQDQYSPDQAHEETAFEAELTRQILMIMDEDNEDDERYYYARRNVKGRPSEYLQRRISVVNHGNYFSWSETGKKSMEVPTWMEKLWASNSGAGTGVFIPRVVAAGGGKSRRRRCNKPRKNNVGYGATIRIS